MVTAPSAAIDAFAHEARAYCQWVRGDDQSHMSLASALRRVATLYTAALLLPHHRAESLADRPETVAPTTEEMQIVTARLSGTLVDPRVCEGGHISMSPLNQKNMRVR